MAEEQPDGEAKVDAQASGDAAKKSESSQREAIQGEAVRGEAIRGEAIRGEAPKQKQARPDGIEKRSEIDFGVPTLRHFTTFSRVTQFAEGYIVAALREGRPLDHMLVHGRPGSGTTTLARAIVRDYAPERVEEIDAQTGVTIQRLAAAFRKINRRGVLLVRHVELLDPACCHMLAGYLEGKRLARRMPGDGGTPTPPWESEVDRAIARSARDGAEGEETAERDTIAPGGTVIATALVPERLSYRMRSAFKQQLHLRNDPKALRIALARVLRRVAIEIDHGCSPRLERVLSTLTDATEPLARTIIARAGLERCDRVDDALMQSIIEEDLPTRLPDTQYAASLRGHLAGRKIHEMTDSEVDRIDHETAWGRTACRAAIAQMLREHRAEKRQQTITLPL